MSISPIPHKVRQILWAKSAGRCQYDGCNQPLYVDNLTKAEFNTSYIAHIIADQPKGPRGDEVLSEQLKSDISNLMLLCDAHHRLIDKQEVEKHTVKLLTEMKRNHEERIELLTEITPDKKSEIILYGANIGEHGGPLSYSETANAITPEFYPAHSRPIELNFKNSSFEDSMDAYWQIETENLEIQFQNKIKPLISKEKRSHLSVFGLAPQPLLIKLGTLISDICPAEVYQLHREPQTWRWLPHEQHFDFQIFKPEKMHNQIALVFSLSADISDQRITQTLANDTSIWKMTIPNPHNDFLKSRDQLMQFRKTTRMLLNEIKKSHGEKGTIHVFPAMPVATAIELGRVWMPKADLPLAIYDQNTKKNGFIEALKIQSKNDL